MASIDRLQIPGLAVSSGVGGTHTDVTSQIERSAAARQLDDINWFLSEYTPDKRASLISVSPLATSGDNLDMLVSDILSLIGTQISD